MYSNDNKAKKAHGEEFKKCVREQLVTLKNNGIIDEFKVSYRCGYEGLNPTQFYAPFMIEFSDGSRWLIFSSTSIRSDRMNIQQWNADHIKRIDTSVVRCYLLLPDKMSTDSSVKAYETKLQSKRDYSALDGVVLINNLENLITTYSETIAKND